MSGIGQTTSTTYSQGSNMVQNPNQSPSAYSHGERSTVETTYMGGSRIVTGEETVIGINTIEGEERIISERVIEHEVRVPKKIVVEEVIEKVIIIPETITREEYIDEIQMIKETIIEVAKPIIQEKIIEVREIEYRDKIIERVERILKEKIKEVPRIEIQERIIEIPKYITREKIVEIPEIEYRDVIIEKIVEVPEYREEVVIKEVSVPQYVEKLVPEYVDIEEPYDVDRNIPLPVEAVTTFEYQLVQFRPRIHKVQYPLYVPRFVEVPVSAELFDAAAVAHLQAENAKLQILSSAQAISLCEVENMATEFRRNDVTASSSNMDLQAALTQAWHSNSIQMKAGVMHMRASAMPNSAAPILTPSIAESYERPLIQPNGSISYVQSRPPSCAASTTTSRRHRKSSRQHA